MWKFLLFPYVERAMALAMQIMSKRTLREFWNLHPEAEGPLRAWYGVVSQAEWKTPADVKTEFGAKVDFVADSRIIFDIAGNKYRLIARVSYSFKRVMVKFVGTHA